MDLKAQTRLISNARYHNSLFEVAIIFGIFVLLVIFVVRPKYNADKAKAEELKASQNQYQTVENDRKTMNQLIEQLNQSKDDVALADQALPLQGRVTSLNLLIDNLVATSGMQLASINTDEGTNGVIAGDKKLLADPYAASRKLQTIKTHIAVTGPVEQFHQLLKLIERSPRLIDIDTISISQEEAGIIYKIGLKAYFYAPEYEKLKPQE